MNKHNKYVSYIEDTIEKKKTKNKKTLKTQVINQKN